MESHYDNKTEDETIKNDICQIPVTCWFSIWFKISKKENRFSYHSRM